MPSLCKVGIYGVPRSGTSWIGEIFNSSPHTLYRYQPLFSYAHKNYLTPSSSSKDINDFFERLVQSKDPFTLQTEKRDKGLLPSFEKSSITHVVHKEGQSTNILFNLMRKCPDVKIVGIIRNPMSVINSWLKAPSEFRSDLGWVDVEEWRYASKKNMNNPECFHGYEKWKEAARIYLYLENEFPDRFRIQKYRSILLNPVEETRKLFDFVGIAMNQQTLDFLSSSATTENTNPYSVFRLNQCDTKWQQELNPLISQAIQNDLAGTELGDYLES